MKRLNVVLNEELHTKLKLTAVEKGVTMSQFVTDLLESALKDKSIVEAVLNQVKSEGDE